MSDHSITFRVRKGINDLASQNPALAAEFHPTRNSPWTPETVTRSSRHMMWWLGKCGHEWQATLNRRAQGQGCMACSDKNKVIVPGFNDFESQYPDLMKEWHWEKNLILPSELSHKSSSKVWWICKLNHETLSSPHHRVQGSGCRICANQEALKGFNDFGTLQSELARAWDPNNSSSPFETVEKSVIPVDWVCERGHQYSTTPLARVNGAGCPVCSRKKFVPGINDLASLYPEIAEEWHPTLNGIEATFALSTVGEYWWQCELGHEWKEAVGARTLRRRGCPTCTRSGSNLERLFNKRLIEIYDGVVLRNKMPIKLGPEHAPYKRMQIDFWLPELKLGFEIQDFATHSKERDDEVGPWRTGHSIIKKGPKYHELKRKLSRDQLGIELIDVWEDALVSRNFKVILKSLLGIGGQQ